MGGWSERRHNSQKNLFLTVLCQVQEHTHTPDQAEEHHAGNN